MRPEVSALLAPGVVGRELLGDSEPEPLFPEEAVAVEKAIDKRKREFALGRSAARRALGELGAQALPLMQNADRSVAWPEGFIGSITHADGYVAAVAAKTSVALGVGIDAESKLRVHDKLWKQIASEQEIAWFQSADSDEGQRLRATCLFSAKEAFYKAQYCVSRAWVGFHDVTVRFDADAFEVELSVDVTGLAPRNTRYAGRYLVLGEHVISVLTIPTSPR